MHFWARKTDTSKEWEFFPSSMLAAVIKTHQHIAVYHQDDREPNSGDFSKVKLKGDFLIDIDSKEITQAIEWANKLLDLLKSWDVDLNYLTIFASGSKGFHIKIPQKLFGKDTAVTNLNRYHGWMAANIEALAGIKLDLQLYHKKHLLRTENHLRTNGRYKVPVTPDEVRAMTPQSYAELCSSPRELDSQTLVPNTALCQKLSDLWHLAKEEVKKELEKASKYASVSNDELNVFNDGKLPQCIEWIKQGASTRGNFNDLSMQLGSFIGNAANVSDEVKRQTVLAFARNIKSDSRHTIADKLKHIDYVIRRTASGAFSFSCGGCKSVLTTNPCEGCPVKTKQEEDAGFSTQIEKRDDGYYIINAKGEGMRYTSFSMERESQAYTMEEGFVVHKSDTFVVTTTNEGKPITGKVTLASADWNTVTRFKDVMRKVSGSIVFQTSDALLANLHDFINSTQTSEQQMTVTQLGIQVAKDEENEKRFWPEKGWSLETGGVCGTDTYSGVAMDTILSMRGVDYARPDDAEAITVLEQLLYSNRPETVGFLLGWASACHLKEHLHRAGYGDFPLLHLAGQAGSGKTSSATVYAMLTGAHLPGGPLDVASCTPSPLRQAMSQTTTVARLFDEFNKPNMSPGRYLQVLAYLKAAYCRQNLAVGKIEKSAVGEVSAATHNSYATSPIIYMSREATENEELVQRSIIIKVRHEDHDLEDYKENFQSVWRSMFTISRDGSALHRIAKRLVVEALNTPSEKCHEWHAAAQEDMPANEHSRREQNLFVIRTGLAFFEQALAGFPEHLINRVQELRSIVVQSWLAAESDYQEMVRRRTTTETLLEVLATMAQLPEGSPHGRIEAGMQYVRMGSTLWVNTTMCFPMYRIYCRNTGTLAEVSSGRSMADLIKLAKYCLGATGPAGQPPAAGWVSVDLTQLEQRGVYADSFSEE